MTTTRATGNLDSRIKAEVLTLGISETQQALFIPPTAELDVILGHAWNLEEAREVGRKMAEL